MDSPCIKQTVCKVFKIFQCGKYLVAYVLKSQYFRYYSRFFVIKIGYFNLYQSLSVVRLSLHPSVTFLVIVSSLKKLEVVIQTLQMHESHDVEGTGLQ